MKNLFLFLTLLFAFSAVAQNRQIAFETGDLASVFAKAKKENKLIFVDAMTTWCGPCKTMAKHVFTNDTVADYFNANFVNLKFDMEKGEGINFAKQYDVNCFPNLIFLDADGNIVHRQAGSMPSKDFMEFAKKTKTPELAYGALRTKYESAPLNESNVMYAAAKAGSAGTKADMAITKNNTPESNFLVDFITCVHRING